MFIDGTGLYSFAGASFMDYKRLMTEDSIISRVKHIMYVNPKIYQAKYPDQIKFKLTKTLNKIGSSSVIIRTKLEDLTSGALLVDRYIKVVRSNLQRKSLKHPEWFTRKFQKCKDTVAPKQLLTKSEMPLVPENCFTLQTKIRYSDLGCNCHMNVAIYLKLCLDCAMSAVSENKLVGFSGDINSYPVVFFESDYKEEGFAGNVLNVKCWQDPRNRYWLKFVIFKEENPVYFSTLKFEVEISKL